MRTRQQRARGRAAALFFKDLRWVDDAGHPCLAVAWNYTVKPNGLGIIDGKREDIGIRPAARGEQAAEEASPIGEGSAW
jgi:hypothetical protein